MKIRYIILIAFSALLINSCYYDTKEELYPQLFSACDTAQYDYTNAIQPLISNNCFGCHSNSSASAYGNNISLEGYSNVKSVAESGKLIGALKGLAGYSPMPKNSGSLDNCSIIVIEKWIANNYPEN
ncbi:MAG: hypothetical protein K9H64_23445 [Bacteroidales bacterium]|nr:hypothetical protein [Bacteroidales bacterium]MCF8458997.1 hypothetical protein [Bacteroidales bacterium]